eukprot:CAMPEP_0195260342 /NCGR_PEP_ID=MMETSP0706-20130129/8519_1 /TAXON_ID=33640 /ORGANISM="Asterionellopsis glacialis, Strain CCMP134" /LENGTH=121 /DNA_ID=CAMNT_0040314047 /DNA_START=13 /DNA_END=378 /DNA_ORIENTATION=+
MISIFSCGLMINDGSTSPSTSVDTSASIDEMLADHDAPAGKTSKAYNRKLRLRRSQLCRKIQDDMHSPIGLVISFRDGVSQNESNIQDESQSIVSDVSMGIVSTITTAALANASNIPVDRT